MSAKILKTKAAPQDDERAIRNVVDQWLSATEKGDVPTVLGLMSDDVVFMVPGKEPFGKKAFAASLKELGNVSITGKSDIKELEVWGDRAWMRNHLTVSMTPADGKIVQRSGYTLTVFRKNPDGSWVIARDANLLT